MSFMSSLYTSYQLHDIYVLHALFQLTNMYPSKFEFNELFLLTLHDHLFSCQFGTFIGNCEKDRIDLRFLGHSTIYPIAISNISVSIDLSDLGHSTVYTIAISNISISIYLMFLGHSTVYTIAISNISISIDLTFLGRSTVYTIAIYLYLCKSMQCCISCRFMRHAFS